MRINLLIFLFVLFSKSSSAYLKYHPITFKLNTDKESYYEGEKITFNIIITNTDKENSYPVLIPHTQNIGQKLFYLNLYDKANNTLILRYTEDRNLNMMVHDTGSVKIKYLKPLEQITIPIYINDFENYFNYYTQNASHHSFGVPLFAGIYKVNITYNPKGIPLADSIYTYYNDFDKELKYGSKLAINESGQISQSINLKIKRNTDTLISIEGKKYYIKSDGYLYYYFNKNVSKINTSTDCIHITNLPPDSCSLPKGEYFYNQFSDLFNEYIARFDDGDIREYRRFTNWCPEYLYTERYNAFKQKTHYELQLPNKMYYSVSYHQPSGQIHQETYCSEDGTLCNVITYVYNKNGVFVKKKFEKTEPCSVIIIDGKKKSAKIVSNLER